jgi:outer membrane immunogenic protein
MRRFLSLSCVSCVLVAGLLNSANAADMSMPFKAPPMAPQASNWSGFYIGVNGGAGWGTAASSIDLSGLAAALGGGTTGITGTLPVGSHELNGFLGGGQIGYNWEFGNFVFGIEGDGDWANVQGTAPCIEILSCSSNVKWTADATARLGVLPLSNMLVYVKGGAAWAGVDYNLSASSITGASISGSMSTTKTGALLGLGTEYLFAPHWSAKIEYDYTDFGNHTDTFTLTESALGTSVSVPVPVQTTLQTHTVKAGVNYHF